MMLADLDIPLSALMSWLPGLIGFLFVVLLLLSIWNAGKKVFGLKPPLDDQFKLMVKTLRGEIMREKNSALKESKLKLQPVEARVAKTEHEILAFQNQLGEIGKHVSSLQTETGIQNQQLARIDSKLDRLVERKS